MRSQADKGSAFRALHARGRAFVMPNPWDAGTARWLAHRGFEALATTSAGYAFSTGRPDTAVGRDEALAHAAVIAGATDLPVNGDLENGYGDAPDVVAETIRLAAAHGLVGCSIEDATARADQPIYPFEEAVERIRAAADAARALPFAFTLTARAENFLHGRPDLDDTVARLRAFRDAGADVVYAPGLTTLEQVRTIVAALDGERSWALNVLAGPPAFDRMSLAAAGVARISLGGLLTRAAFGAVDRAVDEILAAGTFGFASQATPFAALDALFARGSGG